MRPCFLCLLLLLASSAMPVGAFQPTAPPVDTRYLRPTTTTPLLLPTTTPPLWASPIDNYYMTLDTYHALNGAMQTRDVVPIITDSPDGNADLFLIQVVTMLVALLPATSILYQEEEKEQQQQVSKARAARATAVKKVVSMEEALEVLRVAEEISEEVEAAVATEESKKMLYFVDEMTDSESKTLHFADDDLHREEKMAVAAIDTNNREGLVQSLERVTGLVRRARRELKEERKRCKYLANKLMTTTEQLDVTRTALVTTQTDLYRTKTRKAELEKERMSLRKLTKAAWEVSKIRAGRHVRRFLRKEDGTWEPIEEY